MSEVFMRVRAFAITVWLLLTLTLGFAGGGCKEPAQKIVSKATTWAELRVVHPGVTLTHVGEKERAPYARERLTEGTQISLDAKGIAWLRRDAGTTALLRGPAKLELTKDAIKLTEGRLFVDSPGTVLTTIETSAGPVYLSGARASVDADSAAAKVYVLSGEVRTASGKTARVGEALTLAGKNDDKATVTPVTAFSDWTGGLATAEAISAPPPFGVGTVGARKPGSQGAPRSSLTIQSLDVRVTIDGDFATTEIDQTFFNPVSEVVEGIYQFRVPEGAALERFGVDRMGGIAWGYVKEKQAAAAQYQSNVYEGSTEDPALLEWDAPGIYKAKLYPIGPGESRRVVARYTEWLGREGEGGKRRLYVYPMAAEGDESSLPHVEEFNATIDLSRAGAKEVRSGMEATREGETVFVRAHDFVPRADLAVELFDDGIGTDEAPLYRASHAMDLAMLPPAERSRARPAEADYVLFPVRASNERAPKSEGVDLAIVIDASARGDEATSALARSVTRGVLTHLGEGDRVMVFSGSDKLTALTGKDPESVDGALRDRVLERVSGIERGGATDLGEMLATAALRLDPARNSAIVYVGDGQATVGERTLADLKERLEKIGRPVRVFGLGLGDDANMALLAGLASGGFAERVTDEHGAATAALRLVEMASRTAELGVSVDFGANVERVYPRSAQALSAGTTLFFVGRVAVGTKVESVRVRGALRDAEVKVKTRTLLDSGDLRRRWASGRLAEMLEESAGHAALVDLGVRQGIITPVTSIYVPTTKEMTPEEVRAIDKTPRIRVRPRNEVASVEEEKSKDDDSILDGLFRSKSDTATAAAEADNKEGGTGTRAKGVEGQMGKAREKAPSAQNIDGRTMATASPVAPSPAAAAPAEATAARPEKTAEENKRFGVAGPRGNGIDIDEAPKPLSKPTDAPHPEPEAPPPPPALEDAEQKNAPSRDAQEFGMIGLLNQGAGGDGDPWAGSGDALSARGNYWGAEISESSVGVGGGGVGTGRMRTQIVLVIDDPGRLVRLCGHGASLPVEERVRLWRERMSTRGVTPQGAVSVYREAIALCEAPGTRERTRLLLLALDVLPKIGDRVRVFRLLQSDPRAADVVYRGILSRITRPEEVRELNSALGLRSMDPGELEKLIKDAKTAADRVTALRAAASRFPSDFEIALALSDALEDAGDRAGARRFAKDLRKRMDADARVRTAAGELFLRLAESESDEAQKADDKEQARRSFGEIVEYAPDDPIARRRLGDLLRAHGYFDEARRHYETLAKLTPDDPTVSLLIATCANGVGKLEEALSWTEKGGKAGAPDVAQGPFVTARAFAAAFVAWGKLDAKAGGRDEEVVKLRNRLDRLLSGGALEQKKGQTRVLLTWEHPEFHPTLYTNALGTMMPASEGDATLGVAQTRTGGKDVSVELRVEPRELGHAARLGARAILTVVSDENGEGELIVKKAFDFKGRTDGTIRLRASGGTIEEVLP